MEVLVGDIWELQKDLSTGATCDILIPTNVGWRKDGKNVMGRGLAKQAALKYPQLPGVYGEWCRTVGEDPCYWPHGSLWCIPTKPLNRDFPWLSWQNMGDLGLIRRGLEKILKLYEDKIYLLSGIDTTVLVPLLGAGNAGLSPVEVIQVIEEVLGHDERFVRVEWK